MDVKTSLGEGIDAMCVIMNKTNSNEKSLIQNFKSAGLNLDTLFNDKKHNLAVELFTKQYYEKIRNTKKDKSLSDLYILSFISTKTDIYISSFKINIDNIKNVKSTGFTEVNKKCLESNNNSKNIKTENFIDPLFGDVRLYKSKKRLELRLKLNILVSEHSVKLYTL